ncbi:MAG: hypothetical protein NTU88_16765 [Armatimonadetes bacterium]|nr:hypothetical protein [Armatimonadota bacterium]
MRRLNPLVLAVWVLACGTASAAIEKVPNPSTPLPPAIIKPIDKLILADQAKLGKSYPAATMIKLSAVVRQLLPKLNTLRPTTTPRAEIEREVRAAFPGAAEQSDLDAMAFWVSVEMNKGLEQDYQELLSQQKVAQTRQEQVAVLLASTRRRLGDSVPNVPAADPPKPKAVLLSSTLNTRLAFHRAPELTITERDIDTASSTELTVLQQRLSIIGDDAQLANLELQNILQKRQQAIQMISSIMKQMYDTAMAVIRKLGG